MHSFYLDFPSILTLLGILLFFRTFISSIYKSFLRPCKDLPSRYGLQSWAVITGATDGIGKALCYSLARRGFNIALVSRSQEKLQQCSNDLQKLFPSIQTRKDISILINNVGMGDVGEFDKFGEAKILNQIKVNIMAQAILTHKLLPNMLKRTYHSAVIDLSSAASSQAIPFFASYGGTKTFNKFFSSALAEEYSGSNVDFMCLKPFFVTTQMTRHLRGLIVVSPEQCAEGCLRSLGYEKATYGHWWHCAQGWLFEKFPEWVPGWVFRMGRKNFLNEANKIYGLNQENSMKKSQ